MRAHSSHKWLTMKTRGRDRTDPPVNFLSPPMCFTLALPRDRKLCEAAACCRRPLVAAQQRRQLAQPRHALLEIAPRGDLPDPTHTHTSATHRHTPWISASYLHRTQTPVISLVQLAVKGVVGWVETEVHIRRHGRIQRVMNNLGVWTAWSADRQIHNDEKSTSGAENNGVQHPLQ